jgi:GDPmannose 4,6-dehydratase
MRNSRVALITGITGQDGSYLAEFLLERGYVVHGIKRRSSSFNTGRIDHIYFDDSLSNSSRIKLHFGDMTDFPSIIKILSEIQPHEIYNLAAQSHVKVSFETPEYTSNADGIGVLRILEGIRILGLTSKTKFYQASTSEIFGGDSNESLNEKSEFNPKSPYGVAKLFAHFTTKNYRDSYGIFASNGILFNHESPRRGETFVTQKVVKAAVAIKRNIKKDPLKLGNLNAVRDWGHAKDYVEGMYKILQFDKPDDWVLATGETCSVREFTTRVFQYLGIEINWEGTGVNEKAFAKLSSECLVEVDELYFRPNEVNYLKGDASKAKTKLDWDPKYNLDKLIHEMVDFELKISKE